MAEHDPDPNVPANDPEDPAAEEEQELAGPRQRRRDARARARELEEQAAAAAAAAEQARLEAQQDASDSDEEDNEDDDEFADPDEDDDEEDGRVPSVPKGAIKLPVFDGSAGMEKYAASFLEEFESYCEFYRVSGKQRIPLLYTCFPLKTPARSWFSDCKRQNLFTSYAKFKRMFSTQYGLNPAHSFVHIRKLEQLRQGNKSINAFYTELTQAYSDLSLIGVNYSMQQKVTRFTTGMQPALRKKVEEQMSSLMSLGIKSNFTLSAVYNMADAQERILGMTATELRKNISPEHAIEVNAINNRIVCHFCHKPGHVFDDCPKVKAKKAAGTWDYDRRKNPDNPLQKNDSQDN